MEITTIVIGAVVGIVTSIITAYITAKLSIRNERIKWELSLSQKLAELRTSDSAQAESITKQFAIAYLIIEPGRRKYFIPSTGRISIGRNASNDIVVNDSGVSRSSAVFTAKNSRVTFSDLGSRSLMTINGKGFRAPIALKDGDVIELGDETKITFHTL